MIFERLIRHFSDMTDAIIFPLIQFLYVRESEQLSLSDKFCRLVFRGVSVRKKPAPFQFEKLFHRFFNVFSLYFKKFVVGGGACPRINGSWIRFNFFSSYVMLLKFCFPQGDTNIFPSEQLFAYGQRYRINTPYNRY